ncbi:SDR family NAD(P)-dependent oxidoreductase [Hydrogenophaga sp. BPS33]|uniref:SDR family NAD(P)-dependent oxidoreductase n=1 Tax=Hydrogenophaga sp. BPS33 TaxID=2651974 RepID=UPI0013203869|nr:SDR family NAD(P)-dependent oxidoreductase [Hydrogenophaga sp. BPS33]QHE87865.1 SDR family oxidoreductase [Hydrogenophaga sp. BPS33]
MNHPMHLEGQNIIVTGAGQGIGEAVARQVVALGAQAILVDTQGDKVRALAQELGASHAQAHVGSVADADFVQAMVAQAVANHGAVHGLVNNAGIVRAAMIHKMSSETWQQVIDVNLSGVFYCLKTVGQHMLDRLAAGDAGPASIVNISSDAARRGTIGQVNYGAAKAGVLGITMSAAREWAAKGIRVNSVCFGIVETEMTETVRADKFRDRMLAMVPMGRFASAEEVSRPVAFLLSGAASYITGQHLSVNGGYAIGS